MGDVFTAAQAIEAGLSYRWLSAAVARREYDRPFRGVYVRPNAQWREHLVAVGIAAVDGAVTHRAAARLHGLWGCDAEVTELTVPLRRRFSRRGIVVHHSDVDEADLTTVDDITGVTTLARTVIDLAGVLDDEALAIAFESAWCKCRTLLDDLERRLDDIGRGRHGVQRLRLLIADARRRQRPLESPLEVRFWRFVKASGLPLPLTGVQFNDGRSTEYRLDFVYVRHRLAIETDGFAWHRTREQWANDCDKQTRAAAAGYRVMRVISEDLDDPAWLTERLAAALGYSPLLPTLSWGEELMWPG